jgi:broad specificity phosphatase PhoE
MRNTGLRELWLIRHGESTANVAATEAEMSGAEVITVDHRDADTPLSRTGELQSVTIARRLSSEKVEPSTSTMWSSSYARAQQTMTIAMSSAALELPIRIDERLRDRELGVLDTLTNAGVNQRYPFEAARRRWLGKFYYRPPGGESLADVALRVRSFLADAEHQDTPPRAIIATHDAVVMSFLYVCLELSERQLLADFVDRPVANASVTVLSRQTPDAHWSLDEFATCDHLEQHGVPVTEHSGSSDVRLP